MAANKYIKQINHNFVTPVGKDTKILIGSIEDTIIPDDSIPVLDFYYLAEGPGITVKLSVTNPKGDTEVIATDYHGSGEITTSLEGVYTIRYQGAVARETVAVGTTVNTFSIAFQIVVIRNEQPLKPYSVTDVINRILNVGEPHLQYGADGKEWKPKYTLNAEQAAEFDKIEAPEFAFTGMTMRGALDQVGGFIHGVPRLKNRVLYFDMLGGTKVAELCNPKYRYLRQRWITGYDNYATELDSSVENLVNILNPSEGVITEPYKGGFRTVRTDEAYARITDGNMVIETTMPIYMVQKLEVLAPNGVTGDITGYLFEGSDYGRLSSYEGNYPTSKAYAIYYELGQKNIKGLSFKSPTVYGGATATYAIANIIKAATGYDITPKWWGEDGKDSNYPKLLFRITYTPIFSSRIKHSKPYLKQGAHRRSLIYNQGANLVETRYYGENMKGTIARMGNPDFIRIYRVKKDEVDLVPDIGEVWLEGDKEYYVAAVHYARLPQYYDIMLELTENFNRLSQYIGINAEWRAYEVSEQKAYIRDTAYVDKCIVGDPIESDGLELINGATVMSTFTQSYVPGIAAPVSVAVVTTYDEDGNENNTVSLPVISTAFGNTMVFTFGMQDNYSAGTRSDFGGTDEVSGYWQTDIKYTDYYGRVATLMFRLADHGNDVAFDSQLGFDLPQGNAVSGAGSAGYTPISVKISNRLVVDKNGGEILREHYQVQFIANRSDIIIGSAITHNCPLVSGWHSGHEAALYVMPNRIGKFDSKIDMSAGTLVTDNVGLSYTAHRITFDAVTPTVSGAAWAIVDKETGEILLASNKPVTSGQAIDLPTMTFTHDY